MTVFLSSGKSSSSLLETFKDPRGNVNEMTYDALGRLIKDADPAGGFTALNRQEKTGGYTVTSSKASGATTVYDTETLSTGEKNQVNTLPDGTRL